MESARAFALLVDSSLQSKESILRTLANSPVLARGDLKQFYDYAKKMTPTAETTIILYDKADRQLFNTRRPFGAELPLRRASNIQELAARYGSDRTLISDLFFSPVGGKFDFNIQVPVRIGDDMPYFLAMGVNTSSMQNLISRQNFPASWIATIVDRNGVVLARSLDPERQIGKRLRETTRKALASAHAGMYESLSLDDIPVRAYFGRVPNAEWNVMISIPRSEIRQAPLRAAVFLAVAMIVLLSLATFAAHWFARRFFRAIDGLSDAAEKLGQGNAVSYSGRGIREIDAAGERIVEASRKIHQTTAELEQRLENERRQAKLLAKVAKASQSIHAALSVDDIASILVNEAREILEVHQAVVSLTENENWAQAINAVSLSDETASYPSHGGEPDRSEIFAEVCRANRPMRMTQAELERHPSWKGGGAHAASHPPMRGWLAVPLVGHDGKNLGLIQASDKYAGEFTQQDEAILTQLASIAATGFENARLYSSLREQDRRKDDFLAMLAHELRNPLAPISAAAELMGLIPLDADQTRQTSEVISRQVRHMADLVEDLLDVSRVTRGLITLHKVRLNAGDIVHEAMEQVRPLMETKRHRLTLRLAPDPVYVCGDKKRLVQVLTNLLNNAAKYTPEGGAIELALEETDGRIEFAVADNGIGIPVALQSHVFELFSQAQRSSDRSQGGLGIGLALVKSLVELHGGSVACQSAGEGAGSRFIVSLPRTESAQELPDTDVIENSASMAAKRLNILVVDDNVDAAGMLAMYLEIAGHHVAVEHGARQALERARAIKPDACILDIGLPEIDGMRLARMLRADPETAGSVLIALTGYGREQDRQEAMDAGFDHHFVKPVDAGRLAAVLNEVR